jgi:hypothetical protein
MLHAYRDKILPLCTQAAVQNGWLKIRLEQVLPELMQRTGIDMWIVAAREYNEDPAIMTLLPHPEMAARRRTILVFARKPNGTCDRLTVSRYGDRDFYDVVWDPKTETQVECLTRIVRDYDPQVIGLNVSSAFPFGDGLSHHEHTFIMDALGAAYAARVRSAEHLAVGWLERRIAPELTVYPGLVEIGHAIIAAAFSSRVIQPGITTTDDVVWWMRQTMQSMGLQAWFQPGIEIQAPGQSMEIGGDAEVRKLIMPGDLLHCDIGFYYLGLATDQQQHAYVLRPGESAAPAGLLKALAAGNQLQDILLAEMQLGRTGNEVLAAALAPARAAGLQPSIYTHPLGYHGHAAGPTIGLWDNQDFVSGPGEYPLYDDTVYSIELNIRQAVPEWDGQEAMIALEEDAVLTGGHVHWLHGRQTELHLIG